MEEYNLIGKIVKNQTARYRIIHYIEDNFVLCQMDVSFLNLFYYPSVNLLQEIRNKRMQLEDKITPQIMDFARLSESHQTSFQKKKAIISTIEQVFGPSYMSLMGKKHKAELCEICKQYGISSKTLWKYIRNYLQGGCNETTLLDHRIASLNERSKEYRYQKKPGRRWPNSTVKGIAKSPEQLQCFAAALEEYKNGQEKTMASAYLWLLSSYYKQEGYNGRYELKPESELPTYRQFVGYCNKHLTEKEKRVLKTSPWEERNNNRLLFGTSSTNAIRPGWIVEVDALELDCSIVSEYNSSQCIGRPILYAMIDCYSRAIVAFSLSFENNSVLGLTNLLLNLVDDKKDFCSRYGYTIDNSSCWPSNFIPHEMRCDRGSDFKSDQCSKICQRLGINRTLVPGGSGSLKGLVERSFGQLQGQLRPDLEGKGLITKRHDSKHHQQAIFTLHEIMQFVISFVVAHNMKSIEGYPLKKDMLLKLDCPPTPIWLWDYGCRKFGLPNIIKPEQKNQYIFDLMKEETAMLSRKGLYLMGLYYYIVKDEKLARKASTLLNKRVSFPVRIDPRYMGAIYYQADGVLHKATLNAELSGDSSFANMTLAELQEFQKASKERKKKGEAYNLEIDVAHHAIRQQIIDSKRPSGLASKQNMRNARALEKRATNIENRLENHMEEIGTSQKVPPIPTPMDEKVKIEPAKDIYEALDRFKAFEEENFDDV